MVLPGAERPAVPHPSILLALLVVCLAHPAYAAATPCTNADYNGIYAFSSVGNVIEIPPEAPPAGALLIGNISQSGRFLPDGKGGLFIETNASYNGIVVNGDIPATYKVSPSCVISFDLVLPFPLSAPSAFVGVLSDRGRQMSLMLTVPSGTVIRGNHFKQDLRFCGESDFEGLYQVDLSGSVISPKRLAGPNLYRMLGTLVSDGSGNFTADVISNFEGREVPEQLSGTYTVNSRCYVTLKYTSGPTTDRQSMIINGALAGHGERAMVMILTQGWSVAGQISLIH